MALSKMFDNVESYSALHPILMCLSAIILQRVSGNSAV